jgi:deoxycytidylate deaminase
MPANTAEKQSPQQYNSSQDTTDSIKMLTGRQSNELVIAFCGPIGAGIKSIKESLKMHLEKMGYEVHHILLSDIMDSISNVTTSIDGAYDRYRKKQQQGNDLRSRFSPQILAEAAIAQIKLIKEKIKNKKGDSGEYAFKGKVAYLVDQLKNPSEVELLRMVYQHNFYLIGVLRSESERKRNLRDESIRPAQIDELIHLDRKSGGRHGQQVEKTILDADLFIKNNHSHRSNLDSKINRFINLIHGKNGISPTFQEKGMFVAFSASLQSACLSRQVGAAILDKNGNIISTGRNDVPKSGGGLYTYEDEENDYRCIHKGGRCYNDLHKNKIKSGITRELKKEIRKFLDENKLLQEDDRIITLPLDELYTRITNEIFDNTPIGSLIEYSRAIHAEMDAITTLARTGDGSTSGKKMFTTTFPCHNCARHIVAAGIKEVIYIEPYEKSLALDLHDDAINDANSINPDKVSFIQFEGVSPRRYHKFFFATADRKNSDGKAEQFTTKYRNHVDIQFIDSYQSIEDKISADYFIKTKKND